LIRSGGVGQDLIPGPGLLRPPTLTFLLILHLRYLRRGRRWYGYVGPAADSLERSVIRPPITSQPGGTPIPALPLVPSSDHNMPFHAEGLSDFGVGSEANPTRAADTCGCR
jgi:hypothetical protein